MSVMNSVLSEAITGISNILNGITQFGYNTENLHIY